MPAAHQTLTAPMVDHDLERLAHMPAWLLAGADGERVGATLRATTPELADGEWALTACEPKLRLKAGDSWMAAYRLRLVDPHGDERVVRVVGTYRPGAGDSERPAEVVGSIGTPEWRATMPALGLDLRTEQADEGLPALPELTDAERARALISATMRGPDAVRIERCEPEVMRYKPGSRCTVRYHLEYEPGSEGPHMVVAKTYRGDKGANAYRGMAALADAGIPPSTVALAEPLAYLPGLRVLLQGPVDEQETLKALVKRTVAEGGPAAFERLREEVAKAASGLVAVHSSGIAHGETVTWEHERDDVADLAERVAAAVPELDGVGRPYLDALSTMADAHPSDPPGPAHRSFRPAQVLLADGGISFIDFDGLCTAEPAIDVALFRVSLRDAGMRVPDAAGGGTATADRLEALDAVCDHFLDRYRAERPVSMARVALWEGLYLLTSVLHCWTKIKPAVLTGRMATLERYLAASAAALGPASAGR